MGYFERVKPIVDVLSSTIIAIVALLMAVTYFGDRGWFGATHDESPVVEDWALQNQRGIRIGPDSAEVVITEFMDFQCPFCRDLVPEVDSLRKEFPERVAVVFQHFPLSIHEHAESAAVAAECAHRQGRFVEMYHALFDDQSRMGSDSWVDFAERAGVPDLPAFDDCMALPLDSFPRILEGRAIGERTGVTGTPTTWVNGRRERLDTESVRNRLRPEG